MKRLFLTIALAAISVLGLMAEEKTKVFEFGDITRIESGLLYQIHITEGTSGKVTLVYESDYEKHLKVKYGESESKLRLGLNDIPNKFKKGKQPVIHVYLEMDRIDEVVVAGGSAEAFFDGKFTGNDVRVAAGVAAAISDLNLECRNLDLTCSGASRASIKGSVADRMEIELSGASNADLNLAAKELECNISGASSFSNIGNIAECDIECSGASKFTNSGDIQVGNIECSGASLLKLNGKGSKLDLEGSGACKINTKDFTAMDVMLELSGASNAAVYADKTLKYIVSRASKLTYYGKAEPVNLDESDNVVKGN